MIVPTTTAGPFNDGQGRDAEQVHSVLRVRRPAEGRATRLFAAARRTSCSSRSTRCARSPVTSSHRRSTSATTRRSEERSWRATRRRRFRATTRARLHRRRSRARPIRRRRASSGPSSSSANGGTQTGSAPRPPVPRRRGGKQRRAPSARTAIRSRWATARSSGRTGRSRFRPRRDPMSLLLYVVAGAVPRPRRVRPACTRDRPGRRRMARTSPSLPTPSSSCHHAHVADDANRLVTAVLVVSDLDRAVELFGSGFGLDLHVGDHHGDDRGRAVVTPRPRGPTARSCTSRCTRRRTAR